MRKNILSNVFCFLRNSTLAGAVLFSGLVGCAEDFVTARPTVSLAGQALSIFSKSDVQYLEGTYHGCRAHQDTDTWSMAVGSTSAASDPPPVQVVKGDPDCLLKLASIQVKVGSGDPILFNTTPFDLRDVFPDDASLFSDGTNNFYANAKLGNLSYSATFSVSLVYAEKPNLVPTGATASYSMIGAQSVSANGIAAPDYLPSPSISMAVDASFHLVGDASGSVDLDHNTVQGDAYILSSTNPGTEAAALNTAWAAGTPIAIDADADISLDAVTDFHLENGTLLPKTWYVLIAKEDADNPGTRSFQKFTITFSPPAL